MDREYLEDYEQKERNENERFMKGIEEGRFFLGKDKFPPDERFLKLKKPVALAGRGNLWSQVPFSGSLIILIPPTSQSRFEKLLFKTSEIPEVIDFIRKTGRLQVALSAEPTNYIGLDHLDPFFNELNVPVCSSVSISILGNDREIKNVRDIFVDLGSVRYFSFIDKLSKYYDSKTLQNILDVSLGTYIGLKLQHYSIVEEIESSLIDNPANALILLSICARFITEPFLDLRSDTRNLSLEEIRSTQALPSIYRPEEIRFSCEIGEFLLKKLTYAPQNIRGCYYLIDHYAYYDLQKILESLNQAIVTNNPEVVNMSAENLSEILDNVWNDKTIPNRIEGIRIGMPLSIAAIGYIAGGLSGLFAGGFLAELGYKIAEKATDKLFDVKGEKISERLAKLRTKSYQANIYDFKKEYKDKIVKGKHM